MCKWCPEVESMVAQCKKLRTETFGFQNIQQASFSFNVLSSFALSKKQKTMGQS
jgi:hypothetical protein